MNMTDNNPHKNKTFMYVIWGIVVVALLAILVLVIVNAQTSSDDSNQVDDQMGSTDSSQTPETAPALTMADYVAEMCAIEQYIGHTSSTADNNLSETQEDQWLQTVIAKLQALNTDQGSYLQEFKELQILGLEYIVAGLGSEAGWLTVPEMMRLSADYSLVDIDKFLEQVETIGSAMEQAGCLDDDRGGYDKEDSIFFHIYYDTLTELVCSEETDICEEQATEPNFLRLLLYCGSRNSSRRRLLS